MFGFLNIRKPAGPTSHDMVDLVRRLMPRAPRRGERVKVGHAGTLDPFAEGVLVVCVGPAVRLTDLVHAQPKRYRAGVVLGATSTTDDPTGEISASSAAPVDEPVVREAISRFVGTHDQVPPAYSAIQVSGRRAYKLARKGLAPDLPPRPVTIHSIEVLSYAWPRLEIEVVCGGGTYLRALARDLGKALGTGAYCGGLVRTGVGPFRLEDALAPEHVDPERDLISPLAAVEHLAKVSVDAKGAAAIALGRRVPLPSAHPPGEVAVVNDSGELIALGMVDDSGWGLQPTKVFVGSYWPGS
jgi:tRNA pseudouridine55 synthase